MNAKLESTDETTPTRDFWRKKGFSHTGNNHKLSDDLQIFLQNTLFSNKRYFYSMSFALSTYYF